MGIEVTEDVGFSKTAFIVWGALAIVAGFFLVTNPARTGLILVEIMAIFWVVGGIIDIVRSIAQRGDLWGLRLTLAIISLIAGLYIIGNPKLGTIFVIQISFIFLAISALMYGIFNIIAGFRNEDGTSWAAVIVGVLQILIGIWLFGYPAEGVNAVAPVIGTILLVPVLGVFMAVGGIMAIIAAFWIQPASGGSAPATATPATPAASAEPAAPAEPAADAPSEPAG